MPNVLLTQRCVRSCPYCFAKKHMSESAPDDILSWEDLVYLADFFEANGERRFPILGGEPTLHPEFNDILVYLLERGFEVTVFTSGIMSSRMLDQAVWLFGGVPPERLGFTCNLNNPAQTRTTLAESEAVARFLAAFGARVTAGFNIYRADFELDFLFEAIMRYGLNRTVRLGLAHPIAGRRNQHVRPGEIGAVIERLFSYAPLFERLRIRPGLDCGFPLCRFSDEQLGWLYRVSGGHYDFGCAPVIDVGPDMSVWSCFPLSGFRARSLYDFTTMADVRQYYERIHRAIRTESGGLYAECDTCRLRENGLCAGGCAAHLLNAFWSEHPVRMAEIYRDQHLPG